MRPKIEFIDLKAQRRRLGEGLDQAILDIVNGGNYILGPQVSELESQLAHFCGAQHVIATANGTDALGICLMAMKLRPGDAVICPTFTFAATAEAVAWLGATPIFVDVDPQTYNIDPNMLPRAMEVASKLGLRVKALIAVDLFGQMADYDPIEEFCLAYGVSLICDSAQGFGAAYKGRRSGTFGDFTTVSFFPAKPLGCYGDGGAIITQNEELAELVRSLRFHGKGDDKYDNVRIGMNSRLDTIQAAVLLKKLAIFEDEIHARNQIADRYTAQLSDVVTTPHVMKDCISVWAQYTIRVPAAHRHNVMEALRQRGIPTNVYYPKPLHHQTAYSKFPIAGDTLPVSERIAAEVLSLPMYPYLEEVVQDYIVSNLREVLV